MIIYNLTFTIDPGRRDELVETLRKERKRIEMNPVVAGTRLQEVIDVPGQDDFAEQAASVALQNDFSDSESGRLGQQTELESLGKRIMPDNNMLLMFLTILQTL